MPNKIITIYVGSNCHLCEIAKDLIVDVLRETDWAYNEVNISIDNQLKEKYGLRIPVAVAPSGKEKSWPFTSSQIKQLIL